MGCRLVGIAAGPERTGALRLPRLGGGVEAVQLGLDPALVLVSG